MDFELAAEQREIQALARDVAREEIVRESGGQFDPEVVEVFIEREDALRSVRREISAAAA